MMDCAICHKPMSIEQGIFTMVLNLEQVERCCLPCYRASMQQSWTPPIEAKQAHPDASPPPAPAEHRRRAGGAVIEQLDYVRQLEMNQADWIVWARTAAMSISLVRGSVTSDDIREKCDKYGLQPDSVHSYGAIFRCHGWRVIGREPSRYKSNNARWICRWRYEL